MNQLNTLSRLLERHSGVDGRHSTAIAGLKVVRLSAPTLPAAVMYEPSLCVVAQGAKHVMFGREGYRYDAAKYLLVSADVPATAQVVTATARAPYLGLSLDLEPLEVGELVAQLGPEEHPAQRALGVSALDPALLASVVRLVELLESSRDAALLSPLVRREVTYRVLVGPQSPRLRQFVAGNTHGQRITQVMKWLKAHHAEPMSVEGLAKKAAMSPSALYLHFRQVTGLSPLQYQKRLRLQEARRLMLGEALDAAEASFRVGYESPSHFSREYRRLFGAPPRRDIEALRGGQTTRVEPSEGMTPSASNMRGSPLTGSASGAT